ncbi:MAG: teichoic acid ABC transporter ATP-binding protein [Actinobacteria bacterium]|nr:teichoic acid ABC transporter ATP-binding protein [Actinomycetota bacterium]HBF26978.1 teichoic acid ABC transporter ATP-binding protein [Actinomycetota bacterium]
MAEAEHVPSSLTRAIEIRDMHVTYRLFTQVKPGFRAMVQSGFSGRRFVPVEALRGVSLSVERGEAVGIIGRNGSGKSTFLRALAGLLPLASGEVLTTSEPMLLGVNSALRPGLSGRQNVSLGLSALGFTRDEVAAMTDEVTEFADIGDFIDHPMLTYSSGMRARVHLAIATTVRPDILLIDEALAVGDKNFRARSYGRLNELQEQAGVIMLVSHSLSEILRVSTRVVWIEDGLIRMDGEPKDVVAAYEAS